MKGFRGILYLVFLLIANSQQLIANITVLTWNTGRMGEFKKPAENEVLQYLVSQDADVICLQEVDVYKDAQYLTLPDVKRTLSKQYPYSYIDFSVYNKRHQYGTMVWSKYPLIHKQSIHYRTQGNLSNRCDIVVNRDTFRLINNHLESYNITHDDIADAQTRKDYEGLRASLKRLLAKWERAFPLRNEQARVVRQEIEDSPYPVIVVGDFNATAWSYAYSHISEGLHDAWSCTHSWWNWGGTYSNNALSLRIDYILCSDPLVPVSCAVQQTTGSDHKPVVATLEW